MRLARLPVEKRNAVADLPLREALSAIRSREKRLADAREQENRPPPARAIVVYTSEDGQHHVGAEAALKAPRPPANARPPATPDEIADDLIAQLAQAASVVRDRVTIEHLRDAFERRFGPREASDDGLDIPDYPRRTPSPGAKSS
jgi:hypothetical protein